MHIWPPLKQSAQISPPVPHAAFSLPSAWQAPDKSQHPWHDDAQGPSAGGLAASAGALSSASDAGLFEASVGSSLDPADASSAEAPLELPPELLLPELAPLDPPPPEPLPVPSKGV
jgi:hypothetical protein